MNPLMFIKKLFSRPNRIVLLAALLLLLTPLLKPVTIERNVYTFQIGFDISQSMNVADVRTNGELATRLDYAKTMAAGLLQSLPCGSHVGWSVFTGRRTLTLLTPLEVCAHYDGLVSSLASVSGSMRWNNGSSIGKGIHQIMRAADEFSAPASIIFMTDGQEAPPLEQGQRGVPNTDKFEVSGMLVGVGGSKPVPIPKTDPAGNPIGFWSATDVVQRVTAGSRIGGEELSKRDDERLTSLARLTNLEFVVLDSVDNLVSEAKSDSFAARRDTLTDIRWIPASLALLLLLWHFLPRYVDITAVQRRINVSRQTQ